MTTFRRTIEQEKKTFCPNCGFGIPVDSLGNCGKCQTKATGPAVDQLYANRFTIDLNVICADCDEEIEYSESNTCAGCGAVVCVQCLHLDAEGEQFCAKCWDEMLEEDEKDEVKEAFDNAFSTSKKEEEVVDDSQPE